MTPRITSRIEYLISTYNILVLLSHSNLTHDLLTLFNIILKSNESCHRKCRTISDIRTLWKSRL